VPGFERKEALSLFRKQRHGRAPALEPLATALEQESRTCFSGTESAMANATTSTVQGRLRSRLRASAPCGPDDGGGAVIAIVARGRRRGRAVTLGSRMDHGSQGRFRSRKRTGAWVPGSVAWYRRNVAERALKNRSGRIQENGLQGTLLFVRIRRIPGPMAKGQPVKAKKMSAGARRVGTHGGSSTSVAGVEVRSGGRCGAKSSAAVDAEVDPPNIGGLRFS